MPAVGKRSLKGHDGDAGDDDVDRSGRVPAERFFFDDGHEAIGRTPVVGRIWSPSVAPSQRPMPIPVVATPSAPARAATALPKASKKMPHEASAGSAGAAHFRLTSASRSSDRASAGEREAKRVASAHFTQPSPSVRGRLPPSRMGIAWTASASSQRRAMPTDAVPPAVKLAGVPFVPPRGSPPVGSARGDGPAGPRAAQPVAAMTKARARRGRCVTRRTHTPSSRQRRATKRESAALVTRPPSRRHADHRSSFTQRN